MILKLHMKNTGTEVYTNFDNVTDFFVKDHFTQIYNVASIDCSVVVKETPEEIMSMLTVQTD